MSETLQGVQIKSGNTPTGPKTSSIRDLRCDELSRAAFEAVVRYGLRKTTFEKVGKLAGVSKGVVLHHFSDKSALLAAVFRRSNTLLSEALVDLYEHADTPTERLWAIVVANFFDTIFNRSVCQAWVSLSAEIPHNMECQRIQTACNARISSNLKHELRFFLPEEDAERTAHILGMLIDGIWVRAGLQLEALSGTAAISEMEYAILKMLPNDKASISEHKLARQKIEDVAKILFSSKAYREKVNQL